MKDVKAKQDENVADIISTLVVLNRGNFVIEAGRELAELTEAITQTNAKGKLVITLEISPSGWKDDGRCNQVDLKPKITIDKPKKEQGKSIFFVTDDNKLTRDDPAQTDMFAEQEERETNGRR